MSSRYHRYKSPIRTKRSRNESPDRQYKGRRGFEEPSTRPTYGQHDYIEIDNYDDFKTEEPRSKRSDRRHSRSKPIRSKSRERNFSYEPPQEFVPEFIPRHANLNQKEPSFITPVEIKDDFHLSDDRDRFASSQLDYNGRGFIRGNQNVAGFGNSDEHFVQNNAQVVAVGETQFSPPQKLGRGYQEQEISQPSIFVPSFNQEIFAPNLNDGFVGATPNANNGAEAGTLQIPEFNPDSTKLDSKKWINLIEDASKKQGWKDDEKQYIMTSRLTGFAGQWYLSTGINFRAWKDLVNAFLKAFPAKKDYYVLLKNMIARKKGKSESISEYFHHKVALLNACEIYGQKAVSCIIGGLINESLKEDALLQNFTDPDALYLYLRPTDVDKPVEEPKSKSAPKTKKWKTKVDEKICYRCKQKGHLAVHCRYDDNQTTIQLPNVVEDLMSTNKLIRERFTEVKIQDIIMKGYIDRSSDCTTIREDSFQALNLPMTRRFQVIRAHNNLKMPSYGFVEGPLSVDRAIGNVKMYVVGKNAHTVPVVIGKSFLEQRHIYVMNTEDKMRIYQKMDNGAINFDF